MKVRRFDGDADIAPLTAQERRWLQRAQRLFSEAPDRFGFYTGGDCDFTVFDEPAFERAERVEGALDLCDGAGGPFELGTINTRRCVHSVSH
jgi:hypothetical protein